MFKRTSTYIYILLIAVTGMAACKKGFGDLNTNPSTVEKPDVKFLLSYSQDKIVTYQGTEWVWESLEQLMRFTQHVTASPYELSGNVNTRYRNYYLEIMPNLFEIRRQIDASADKEKMQRMRVITYILQVLQGIKVTDMNGSIPYTEAVQGRYGSKYNPVYDNQQTLFSTWLKQLDTAITVLSDGQLPAQQEYGTADIYYNGDWSKWIMLANTLKLRIAARVENQDAAMTKQLFQQVMQDATGPITTDAAQVVYSNATFTPFGTGGDIDYRSRRFGSTSIISFLKSTRDPRLAIYFDKNDLVGSYKDTLTKYGVSLPSFINPSDPLIMYQGGPADWNTNPTVAAYISNAFRVGGNNYFLISPLSRRFFSPKLNGATGNFTDVPVTAAESCFYIAEFIQKGYGAGIDTKGTAEDWYNKGIASSIRTMNSIAVTAGSTTAFTGTGDTEISAFQANPLVKLNGINNLERIYIQEYLAFYRQPNEAFIFCRRTGYPKLGSAYYARETFNEPIPRRFALDDPGEVNRANWQQAMTDQGFTPRAQDVVTLSKERIWYDKVAPDFGKGN